MAGDPSMWTGPDEPLTRQVIGAAIQVHKTLGSGFIEGIYRNALIVELQHHDLAVETEKVIEVYFRGQQVGLQRIDLLIEERLIIEVKAVEALHGAHYAQLRSYLRAMNLNTGLLINFLGTKVDYRRVCWDP